MNLSGQRKGSDGSEEHAEDGSVGHWASLEAHTPPPQSNGSCEGQVSAAAVASPPLHETRQAPPHHTFPAGQPSRTAGHSAPLATHAPVSHSTGLAASGHLVEALGQKAGSARELTHWLVEAQW